MRNVTLSRQVKVDQGKVKNESQRKKAEHRSGPVQRNVRQFKENIFPSRAQCESNKAPKNTKGKEQRGWKKADGTQAVCPRTRRAGPTTLWGTKAGSQTTKMVHALGICHRVNTCSIQEDGGLERSPQRRCLLKKQSDKSGESCNVANAKKMFLQKTQPEIEQSTGRSRHRNMMKSAQMEPTKN